MTLWQYLTETISITDKTKLSALGMEGWELVTAVPVIIGGNANKTMHCVFKRPMV